MPWKKLSHTLSLIAASIGAIGFAGWVFEIDALKRIHPALVTMKANTGLCLMLAGLAVALLNEENVRGIRRRVSQGCAIVISTVGSLTLGEYLGWWQSGIDQVLFQESIESAGRSFPGRMGPLSAVNFVLLGAAVLLLDARPRRGSWPAQICAVAVIATTFVVFLAYFYAVELPQPLAPYLSIALHTVVAFLLLAAAILLARPVRGMMAAFLADNIGGVIARRMLPAALLLPVLFGWLATLGRNAGLYGRGVGTALLAASLTLVFTSLVWWSARALAAADARRRSAEEDLQRSERELSDFFDNAAVSLHWVGPDGRVLRVNDTELALLGYAREEYVGRSIADFHADAETITDILARLAAGETLTDYPAQLRCKDGSLRDVLIHSSVYWEDGKFVHTRCFTRDVTEQRRAEAAATQAREAAETANRAKDDFLAVLSHELRTPLTPALIRRNIKLEARLVDDLLDLTRINRGKLRIASAPVDLHTTLRDALAIAEPMLREKRITVATDFAASESLVRGDSARLAQVFANLLTNAAKFTPEEGHVSVSTAHAGEDLRVEVTDTGIGIAPEVLPKIFDAFRQGGDGTTRRFGGLGLGLNVAQSLVEAHGGTIAAASTGCDRGATFAVTLPAFRGVLPDPRKTLAPPPTPVAARSLRVLMVEDHEDTRRVLRRLLERWGHRVQTAGSVAEACAILGTETFDLLLSDLGLPDGTGLEVVATLRAQSDIPAIAMSGYGMEADLARARTAGFTEHLVKPVAAERLREVLDRLGAR